ncbi:MAG: VOC family protein [Acidimicrobiales bacterium]
MPTRDHAPSGAPCWADLWTSDVEGSRRFYAEVFGWEAQEPNPEFGGYFMFTRDGVPVAGGMGDMGDMKATDTWKVYFETPDIEATLKKVAAGGGQVVAPAAPVADLGMQAVMLDRTGAQIGAWQPGTFPGFAVIEEPGSPSWFELYATDHAAAVAFYRSVFGWETDVVSDTDEFRYSTMRNPEGEGELAGLADGRSMLQGATSYWSIYWAVDDVAASVAKVEKLGGSLQMGPNDTPYGVLACMTDPAGARFNLRRPPA